MKKSICILCVLACFITCFTACGCEHTWREATCLLPKTCTNCNQTEGEALGHTWVEATCTAPKTCSVCNTTEGEPLAHTWVEATCKAPKTCSVCKATQGKVAEHQWQAATCTTKKTCKVCKKTEGNTAEHKVSGGVCVYCKKKLPNGSDFKLQSGSYIGEYVDKKSGWYYCNWLTLVKENGGYGYYIRACAPTSGKGATTTWADDLTQEGTFTFNGKKFWVSVADAIGWVPDWIVTCKGSEVIVKQKEDGTVIMKFKGNSNGSLTCTYHNENLSGSYTQVGVTYYPEKDFVGKAKGHSYIYD